MILREIAPNSIFVDADLLLISAHHKYLAQAIDSYGSGTSDTERTRARQFALSNSNMAEVAAVILGETAMWRLHEYRNEQARASVLEAVAGIAAEKGARWVISFIVRLLYDTASRTPREARDAIITFYEGNGTGVLYEEVVAARGQKHFVALIRFNGTEFRSPSPRATKKAALLAACVAATAAGVGASSTSPYPPRPCIGADVAASSAVEQAGQEHAIASAAVEVLSRQPHDLLSRVVDSSVFTAPLVSTRGEEATRTLLSTQGQPAESRASCPPRRLTSGTDIAWAHVLGRLQGVQVSAQQGKQQWIDEHIAAGKYDIAAIGLPYAAPDVVSGVSVTIFQVDVPALNSDGPRYLAIICSAAGVASVSQLMPSKIQAKRDAGALLLRRMGFLS